MLIRSVFSSELKLCRRILARGLSSKPSWDIVAGVCVERQPVVTPPMNEIQTKYLNLLRTIEVEKSLKSDHELRHENDKVQAELLKKDNEDVDMDAISKITAQDFEDASHEELSQFTFEPIQTEADKKNDKTTVDRCLQRHLVLVSQMKLGNEVKSILPQSYWKDGETLRQSAERTVAEQFGPEFKVQFVSNAPCGFYKYKYPSEINGKIGAKVFFYFANYKGGQVTTKSKVNWLTRNELTDVLPEKYSKSVNEFLIHESY